VFCVISTALIDELINRRHLHVIRDHADRWFVEIVRKIYRFQVIENLTIPASLE
jgi:hypothetical protein